MTVPWLRFKEFSGEWEVKTLSYVCNKIMDGTHFSPKSTEGAKKYLTSKNIRNTGLDISNCNYISEKEHQEIYKKCPVKLGDVLLTKDGANTGNCCINTLQEEFSLLSSVAVLNGKENLLNTLFLLQILQGFKGINTINNAMAGQAISRITLEKINKFKFSFPKFPEQTKIANFLMAVDEKITQITQKGDLLARYKKGVMQQIFSQQLRFKDDEGREFPDWKEKELRKVTDIIMGQSPDSKSYNDTAEGKPLIQGNADISNRRTSPRIWTSVPTKECKTNDIILTVRAPVGAVAKSYHNACIGRGVCAIRSNYKSNVDFIYQLLLWFEPTKWVSLEQGSTFTAVNSNDIKTLIIPVPCIEEQTKIANFLTALDDKITHNQTQLNALKQYKQGLLQQMFA